MNLFQYYKSEMVEEYMEKKNYSFDFIDKGKGFQ